MAWQLVLHETPSTRGCTRVAGGGGRGHTSWRTRPDPPRRGAAARRHALSTLLLPTSSRCRRGPSLFLPLIPVVSQCRSSSSCVDIVRVCLRRPFLAFARRWRRWRRGCPATPAVNVQVRQGVGTTEKRGLPPVFSHFLCSYAPTLPPPCTSVVAQNETKGCGRATAATAAVIAAAPAPVPPAPVPPWLPPAQRHVAAARPCAAGGARRCQAGAQCPASYFIETWYGKLFLGITTLFFVALSYRAGHPRTAANEVAFALFVMLRPTPVE